MKALGIIGGIVTGLLILVGFMFGIPTYKVWEQEMAGKARLAEATQSRNIMVEQARAEKEAAVLQVEAIAIMGEAAKKYPEYRTQEYMSAFSEALREGKINQVFYIPTEAGMPILEAGRAASTTN